MSSAIPHDYPDTVKIPDRDEAVRITVEKSAVPFPASARPYVENGAGALLVAKGDRLDPAFREEDALSLMSEVLIFNGGEAPINTVIEQTGLSIAEIERHAISGMIYPETTETGTVLISPPLKDVLPVYAEHGVHVSGVPLTETPAFAAD